MHTMYALLAVEWSGATKQVTFLCGNITEYSCSGHVNVNHSIKRFIITVILLLQSQLCEALCGLNLLTGQWRAPALFMLRRNVLFGTWLASREIIEQSQLCGEVITASTATLLGWLQHSPTPTLRRSTVDRAVGKVSVSFHVGLSLLLQRRRRMSEQGLAVLVRLLKLRRKYCYVMHWYPYWYWVLVSAVANIIGYWVAFLVSF